MKSTIVTGRNHLFNYISQSNYYVIEVFNSSFFKKTLKQRTIVGLLKLWKKIVIISLGEKTCIKYYLEYVHMRGEMNSNRYEISIRLKISLPCSVNSLLVFTWIETKWYSRRYGFHIGHFDRNEISNWHGIFMWT